MARTIFFTLFKLLYGFHIKGQENILKKGGFIIASNHVSNLDPILLGTASPRIINYMAKEDLFKNKFFGNLLSFVGAFPVKRNNADIFAIKEAIRRLRKGCGLVIFPQGTRRQTAGLDVQSGIGMLAYRAQVPVIPAFIKGSQKALPVGAKFLRPARIRVIFGKPLYFSQQKSYPEIAHIVMREINNLVL